MEETKNKNKKYLLILLALLLLLGAAGTGFYFWNEYKKTDISGDVISKIEQDMSDEELQEMLNQKVEDSMINIQYSMHANFNGKTSTSFLVRNIENNKDSIQFSIYDENNELIYTSDEIERGYEVTQITLDKELSAGHHDCTINIGYANSGNVRSSFPLDITVN